MKEADSFARSTMLKRAAALGLKVEYDKEKKEYLFIPPDNPDCAITKHGLVESYHFIHGVEYGRGWNRRDRPF